MKNLKKILFLITNRERKLAYLLIVMILIMSLLEMVGVASIFPFMSVLANPDIIETNVILKKIFDYSKMFGVENYQQFLFFFGIFVFLLLVATLFFKAFTTYAQARFCQMREYTISKRFVEGYLNQPYSWFLSRHSSDLGNTILSEVAIVVGRGIVPMMEIISKGFVIIAILILLIIVDPKLALTVFFFIGLFYGIIYKFSHRYVTRLGKENLKNNKLRFNVISEAFSAIKQIKLKGLEHIYLKNYSSPAQTFARNQTAALIISQLPRFFLEALAFGGIILMLLYLIIKKDGFNNALPLISLYVFAGYRLLPAMQQIYHSLINLTFVGPSLERLCNDIIIFRKPLDANLSQDIFLFNKSIVLKKICYNYPNQTRTALKDISIEIPYKAKVALVGPTGSGKTTIIDIILGLLETQSGTLEIDGKVITKQNLKSWQRLIGYVPQHIYLSDDTIAANIAFGVDSNFINQEVIENVSKIANLHNFINNELPKKYHTLIGENGVRLSGGERQRIGIARALYHQPKVLILDEATSSLDNQTEHAIIDALNNLKEDVTVIMIAHRLNTVKNCDFIFKIDKGKFVDKVLFEKL
jgi:ABC-type multidrug transport system fused ATPase/permease subunit